jgi:hypothetical protein
MLCGLPCDFDSVELHSNRENRALLTVFYVGARAKQCAKVVVLHLVLVLCDELAPPLLARLALQVVFVQCRCRVKVGKFFLEVFENLVVDLGKAQL